MCLVITVAILKWFEPAAEEVGDDERLVMSRSRSSPSSLGGCS